MAAIEDQSDDMGESLPPSEVAAQKAPDLIEFTAQMGKLVDSLSVMHTLPAPRLNPNLETFPLPLL